MNSRPRAASHMNVHRSQLIMPVHVERFVREAWRRGCDQITLDLEDSVPPDLKDMARTLVKESILLAARGGASVSVRINRESWQLDIEASVWSGLGGIVFPKAEDAEIVIAAARLIESLESARGIPAGSVALSLLIETVKGLNNAPALLRSHPRVKSLSGPAHADFTVDLGITLDPTLDQLDWARGELDLLVRAAGNRGLGRWSAGQAITEYGNQTAIRQASAHRRRDGSRGGTGIHPTLIDPFNAGFTPPAEEVEEAEEIISASEAAWARGEANIVVRGRIVTPRVAEAARLYVDYATACRAADERKGALIEALKLEMGEG